MNTQTDSLQEILENITPEIHQKLKSAIELGRWENGDKLSDEQKANCLQAVIAYDQTFLAPEQRVGYLNKQQCKTGGSKNKTRENNQ